MQHTLFFSSYIYAWKDSELVSDNYMKNGLILINDIHYRFSEFDLRIYPPKVKKMVGKYDISGASNFMMTSSNGNIFRVTGPLCGAFTGHR